MAWTVFSPIFPCKFMKSLMKLRSLKFIHQTSKFDVLRATAKVSAVKTAQPQKYRCKDVAKLMQVEKTSKLVKHGYKVLDIGAATGSWSQFLAEQTNSNRKASGGPVGMVIAIDINDFESIDGVHCLPKMDFLKESSQNAIIEILGKGKKFDFIFSDMSPYPPGLITIDKEIMVKTIFYMYLFMMKYLKKGGGCLVKVQGVEGSHDVREEAKRLFKTVDYPKLRTSKEATPDVYLIGREFLGGKT